MDKQIRRLRGGLLGLLVGDALGVPYEFHHAGSIPADADMVPPPGFARTYANVPPGTWSDDGAQALVLLESMLRLGRLDVEDVGRGFLAWHRRGFCAVDGDVFDVGNQTLTSLTKLAAGTPAADAGGRNERSNGNGSLMRVLPLALLPGDETTLVADAMAQSAITHAHPRSRACCALYCLLARRLLQGVPAGVAWDDAVAATRSALGPGSVEYAELDAHVLSALDAPVRGSGYVVHSLLAARHLLLTHTSYEGVVRGAVALGEDTDTTAAIAGGLAGCREGEDAIPATWLELLRGREILDPLLDGLGAAQRRS